MPAGRVQRAGGLVEEQDLGAVHQRLRQVQPLAHSPRVAGDAAAGGFDEACFLQHFIDA